MKRARKVRRRLSIAAAISAFFALIGLCRLWRAGKHEMQRQESRDESTAAALIGLCFVVAMACGVGLLVVYALGGQVQLEGALLGGSLGGIGLGLILWGKHLFPHEIVTEEREPLPSDVMVRAEAGEMLEEAEEEITRRRFLTRMLVGAGGAFLVAMVFPLRSLGPSPGTSLLRTKWARGALLVDETGLAVRHTDLPVGGVLTVFPEHHTDAQDSQAILVRVEPDQLRLPGGSDSGAPGGNVCYSKICTHAGCPVGLYLAQFHQLQCPCHQSAFDVLDGGSVVFGPAPRNLPRLSIYVDGSGFLRANGDFPEPVGPGWWNRPSRTGGSGGVARS